MDTFNSWLRDQLLVDGVIDEDFEDDLTESLLYDCTELSEQEIEQYKSEYEEYCSESGKDPVWDVPED